MILQKEKMMNESESAYPSFSFNSPDSIGFSFPSELLFSVSVFVWEQSVRGAL